MDTQSNGASGPGLMPPPGFMEREFKTPSRVSFAFDIVHWANDIESDSPRYEGGTSFIVEGRPLREDEKAVYGAALEVMRNYLTGEMSFDDEELEDAEEKP